MPENPIDRFIKGDPRPAAYRPRILDATRPSKLERLGVAAGVLVVSGVALAATLLGLGVILALVAGVKFLFGYVTS